MLVDDATKTSYGHDVIREGSSLESENQVEENVFIATKFSKEV